MSGMQGSAHVRFHRERGLETDPQDFRKSLALNSASNDGSGSPLVVVSGRFVSSFFVVE